ncbi:lipopolysaccharide biosynthesis protein [Bradyrhizobium arachidis]|uniref:lipopolysaccharide biosynthesis protein n=1 Tax=Bradyrhizobium arachidis TaxID=858423 RepID=UPI00131AC342|nr:oligosaccharide flippase family protein [Bradyrhizobium arachidis]UFW47086.1 oligosaccharide flippase family protein [Bradyrhizobium arachidis]
MSVAILPLTTVVLTAADFGYFALMMSWAALASAFGDAGGSLALPANYSVASIPERRRMLSSFFLVSLLISSGLAVLFVAAWPWLQKIMSVAEEAPRATLVLTALLVPLKSATILSTNVFAVAGRGNAVAAQIALQAVGSFAGTLISLFGFHLGVSSLFVGAVFGQGCSVAVALAALGGEPWHVPSRRWLSVLRSHSPTSLAAGLTGGLRSIGENSVVAANLNISAVGYLSHARLYYGTLLAGTNAVAVNVWSTSLAEARDRQRQFSLTKRVWMPIHVLIALFGVTFSCFGEEFVAILTHDRLTPAAQLVPWFALLLLLHVSGRTQNATVYANGGARSLTNASSLISICCLAALPFAVGKVGGVGWNGGLAGVVIVLLAEAILFRAYIYWKSSSFQGLEGFDDSRVVCGSAAIILSWLFNAYMAPTLMMRIALCVAACVAAVIVERERIIDLLRVLQNRSQAKIQNI